MVRGRRYRNRKDLASQLEDLSSITVSSQNEGDKNDIWTAYPLDAQHKWNGVEKKSAMLLVLSVGEELNRIPPILCGN